MSPDSFDWGKYVDLAEKIYQQREKAGYESNFRTGISRAYYGIYNICRNFAIDNGLIDKKKLRNSNTSHADLIDQFSYSNRFDIEYTPELNKVKKAVGEILKELRDYRNDADYQDVYPKHRDIIRDLKLAVESAKEVINSINNLQEEMLKIRDSR